MATWQWVLADDAGAQLCDLDVPGRFLTFARNAAPEATCSLHHDEEAAWYLSRALRNGIPRLLCYRDGILRFRGVLDTAAEDLSDAATLTPTFRGPFARLVSGGNVGARYTGAERTFTQEDQGTIAWTLISEANATTPTGIVLGAIEPTVPRDRTYQRKAIGEAIVELSQVQGGFDFSVEPVDYDDPSGADGAFYVYAEQGQFVEEAIFEYGHGTLGNVSQVRRTTTPPVNRVVVLGANGLVGERSDQPSIDRYGEYCLQVSATDVVEQATLDAKAEASLRPDPVRVVSFTPDPDLAPQPWDDYWLGDTLSFVARRGFRDQGESAFEEALEPRLNGLKVGVSDDGQAETHELTIDQGGA